MNFIRTSSLKNFKILLAVAGIAMALLSFGAIYTLTGQDDTAQAQQCAADICVDVTENGMQPAELAVKAGQYVQFNTKDGQYHNLALGQGAHHDSGAAADHEEEDDHGHEHLGTLQSGRFGPDEGWRVQFSQTGTFVIHDHHFPENSILIVVYND